MYRQSTKNKRELKEIATNLDVQLLKIGNVLSTRWIASSYRTDLLFGTTTNHFINISRIKQEKKEDCLQCLGLNKQIQYPEFLLDLTYMCDVLFELSELFKTLQRRSRKIVKADRCIRRTIRNIESLKCKIGTKMLIASDSIKAGKFRIVPLRPNQKHTHRYNCINLQTD